MDDEKRIAIRKLFPKGTIWKVTLRDNPDAGCSLDDDDAEDNFGISCRIDRDTMHISLEGSLNSLTAPELIEKFESFQKRYSFRKLAFDMEKLRYISSAGQRILKMIQKTMNGSAVILKNCNDTVLNILNQSDNDGIFQVLSRNHD